MKNQNRLISHLRTSFCALVIVGAPLAFPSAEASGPPLPANGEFFPCFNFAGPPRQVGENLIITFNVTGTITGTFVGSFVGTEMQVVHPDGSINLHGSFGFSGSVNGSSGTLLVTYEGIGNAVTHHESLQVVARQGTGGLAGVYANLTAEGDIGAPNPGCDLSGAGTYTGQILFAP
jgi:Protein of unknown function (DUF3224)